MPLSAWNPKLLSALDMPALEADGVLPDPQTTSPLAWGQVKASLPLAKDPPSPVDVSAVDELLLIRDKKEFSALSESIWPPRSKTDLSIRRSRLLDFFVHARRVGKVALLREVLTATRVGWDLIWVTNLVVAAMIFGRDWWYRWLWLGAYDGDITHYITCAKKVHDTGKSVGIDDPDWTRYVECAALVGYRNMPFPGFDKLTEARNLAEGGDVHNYFGRTWETLCQTYLPMKYHQVPFVSFDDFVLKAEWLTGGASSVGRLELSFPDGTTKSVKARKNMVADVIDLEELAADARASKRQVATTIVKSELGKLRIAVAGDIYTYLQMTWITNLLGGAYYDWPGNTSEESFTTQTERLAKMLALCARGFGLPYDYAGFDHQPTTVELIGIAKRLIEHARLNVPQEHHSQFDEIAANVVSGFEDSILMCTEGKESVPIKVTGGLMSGLRWTSIVGNAWNSIMTGLALEVLQAWGYDTKTIERFIRGDDSAIFTTTWSAGAAMNLAYDAIGAKSAPGKYSLQYGKMEFLRVWFSDHCEGYPVRALPGITQRKPWSGQPWEETMVIRAIYEAIRTLKRRALSCVPDLKALWITLRSIWCRNHNLPVGVMAAPSHAGGFGIEPLPVGISLSIVPPVPRASPERDFSVLNQRPWRAQRLTTRIKSTYDIVLDPERAHQMAATELALTVASDNVPDVARYVRQSWLSAVRSAGCRVRTEKTKIVSPVQKVDVCAYQPEQISMLLDRLKVEAPLFGSCPEVETARADYDIVNPPFTFTHWLRLYFPRVHNLLSKFHRSWHSSEKLDYLAGRISLATTVLHPALVGVLSRMVASTIPPSSNRVRNTSGWMGSLLERVLFYAPVSQRTYLW